MNRPENSLNLLLNASQGEWRDVDALKQQRLVPPTPADESVRSSSVTEKMETSSNASDSSSSEALDEKLTAAHLLTAISRHSSAVALIEDDLPPLASILSLISMSRGNQPPSAFTNGKYPSAGMVVDFKHGRTVPYMRSPESIPATPRQRAKQLAQDNHQYDSDQLQHKQPHVDDYMKIDSSDKKRKFRCAIAGCDKGFPSRAHLERHQRGVHFKIRPFKCPHPSCEKHFSRHDNMMQHFRSHSSSSSSDLRNDQHPAPMAQTPRYYV